MERKGWTSLLHKYLHCYNLTHKPIHPDSLPLLLPTTTNSSDHITNHEQEEFKVEKQIKESSRTDLSIEDESLIKSLTAQMMIGCTKVKSVTAAAPPPDGQINNNGNGNGNEMKKADWIEKYEPSGVYIIFKTHTDGAIDLNQVYFSRRGTRLWEENGEISVYEVYTVGRPNT